ncbi:MAG TPA: mechanosensitive ion channel family protein [Candidatus Binatia bacterium]|nr:mechanosensitive ion channel family protein [Candidatus Binatia bacterium]
MEERYDQISVTGFEGRVTEIDLRYTTLEAEDKKFLIPNSTLFTNPISLLGNQRKAGQSAERTSRPAGSPNEQLDLEDFE